MKTASEIATEYWSKPPVERINTTVQDYVFDYQQKKIDALIKVLKCGSLEEANSLIYTYFGYDHYYDRELNDAVKVVEELLK